ncbi:AbrB family transcriptional regulator [Sneathiella limimaris]|uniref:AbrB family transcriptional regulator n=1 Tax=Sneathiella limimaris TaxID=1964213 RepID=UPI00146D6310|nr:AbrB family transcriptional regulator [Sneathiella limimaris]
MVKSLKSLFIGAIGGALFFWANLPLAWMMGAMCITTIVALKGVDLHVNGTLRKIMTAILGLMLGTSFSPETLGHLSAWTSSLTLLAVNVIVCMSLVYWYFRYIGKFDRVTAFFSSAPGGFNVMYEIGEEKGGDGRSIALIHATRILLLVMTVPLFFRYATDIGSTNGSTNSIELFGIAGHATGYILMVVAGISGYFLGGLLKLPAHHLLGPMLFSGILSITGLIDVMPPMILIYLAQLVIGTAIGLRFLGTTLTEIRKIIMLSIGSTTLMIGLATFFALVSSDYTHVSVAGLVLALSPGGLAEMSLVALALGIDVAFVSIMHVVRIAAIITIIPVIYPAFEKRWKNRA